VTTREREPNVTDPKQPEDAYEAPHVEQIETEDQPAVTAAGLQGSGTTTTD
jgi:hypothetical protein